MLTNYVQRVPRVSTVIDRTPTVQAGHVVIIETPRQVITQDVFGPLDWVRFLKSDPLPRSQAKQDRATHLFIWAGTLLVLAVFTLVVCWGPNEHLQEAAWLIAPLSLLGALGLWLFGLQQNHPHTADGALVAMWGGFAAANAQQGRWGWAAVDAASIVAPAWRIHQTNEAARAALSNDQSFWQAVEAEPLGKQWQVAHWYYGLLRQEIADLRGIPVGHVGLRDYDATVTYLRQVPQSW